MSETTLHWVGIDVAGETFDAAVARPGLRPDPQTLRQLPAETFARTPEGVAACVAWLREELGKPNPLPARVVMEATGTYSIELTAMLCKECPELSPAIANPQQTAAHRDSLGLRNKTDRFDARALAFYGLERIPAPYEPLSPQQAELRALSRCRDGLMTTKTAHANQLAQNPAARFARKSLKRLIAHLEKEIDKLEKEMRAVIENNPDLKRDYDLLTTIPGVGFITAAVVLAEVGDLRRFGTSRQVAAFAGVTPSRKESGKSKSPGRMSKKGNARIRQALYMASLSACAHNLQLRTAYERMTGSGKEPMMALGAVMRKLIVLMRAIIVSETPFNPCGKTRGKVLAHG